MSSDVSQINLDNYSSIILSGRRKNDISNECTKLKINPTLTRQRQIPAWHMLWCRNTCTHSWWNNKKNDISRHGLHQVQTIASNPLCNGKISAFESHSYMVSKLSSSFTQIASSDDCKFEIFQYGNKNIFGTQFHPEMSVDGRSLLEKFSTIK